MTLAVSLAQGGTNNVTMRNRIINGGMVIDQRNAGASVTLGSGYVYTVDRFKVYSSVTSKLSAQQTPSATETGYATRIAAGFRNYLGLTSLAATSPAAGDEYELVQVIEGVNAADFGWGTAGAQSVTLSFWVRSSLTGTFGGCLYGGQYYPFTYTISAANTWEQKTITIAGSTSGTWTTGTGAGITLLWDLGCGTNFNTTSPNAWGGTFYARTSACQSVVGTNGATFYITGVQLEAGTTATAFEQRLYGTELALCQRYLPAVLNNGTGASTSGTFGVGFSAGTTQYYVTVPFAVQPRVPPTGIVSSAASQFQPNPFTGSPTAASAVTFSSASLAMARIYMTTTGLTAGTGGDAYMNNTSAYIYFTGCEL